MKLERHIGGLSLARKANYLRRRGWREVEGRWVTAPFGVHPLARAIHHQLTRDLSEALSRLGWRVLGHSKRGYAQLRHGECGPACSLPKALRIQARFEKRPVAELTYTLFLAVIIGAEESLA